MYKGDKGDTGTAGKDGRGIAKTELVNGELIITYTDGTSDNLGKIGSNEYTIDSRLIFTLLSDGTYSVSLNSNYKDSVTEITIPEKYNDIVVSTISKEAFKDCPVLKKIEIPNTVKTIGGSAFNSCVKLSDIVLPSELSEISYSVFKDCTSLSNIEIPSTVTNISYDAFRNSGLKTITIPHSVIYIGSAAFDSTSDLETVYFENKSGWIRINSMNSNSKYSVKASDLEDPTNAAELLKKRETTSVGGTSYNATFYWERS